MLTDDTDTDYEKRLLRTLGILDGARFKPIYPRPNRVLPVVPNDADGAHVVYFMRAGRRIKIGRSRNIGHRVATIQTSTPERVELLGVIAMNSADEAERVERESHKAFADLWVRGEWFQEDPDLSDFIQTHARRPR